MTTKETIQKSDDELREDCKNVYALVQKGVLNEYQLFLFFKGHTSLRGEAIIEAHKEELREAIYEKISNLEHHIGTDNTLLWRDHEISYKKALFDVLTLPLLAKQDETKV